MKLYTHADAPRSDRDTVYRHPPTYLMMVTIALVIVAMMLTLSGAGLIGYFFIGLIAAAVLIMRPMLKARRRSTNWLARITTDGLLLHFRSYLNFHFPNDAATVVLLPYSEICSARVVRQKWSSRDAEGSTREARDVVELELANGDVAVERAIAEDRARQPGKDKRWYGTSSIRFRDFPVRLNGSRMLIEWTATPDARQFVEDLAAQGVTTAERQVQDFTKDKTGLESLLIELAESGKTLQAVKIARDLYGYDVMQARNFVEGLQTSSGKKLT